MLSDVVLPLQAGSADPWDGWAACRAVIPRGCDDTCHCCRMVVRNTIRKPIFEVLTNLRRRISETTPQWLPATIRFVPALLGRYKGVRGRGRFLRLRESPLGFSCGPSSELAIAETVFRFQGRERGSNCIFRCLVGVEQGIQLSNSFRIRVSHVGLIGPVFQKLRCGLLQ